MEIHKFEPKKKYIEDLEDTSESDTVYHRLEQRRTSLEVPSNPQFIDSVSTSTEHGELICQSSQSSTQSTKEQEICDLCSKTFTKRGITKHRNSCFHLNKLLFDYFF